MGAWPGGLLGGIKPRTPGASKVELEQNAQGFPPPQCFQTYRYDIKYGESGNIQGVV